MAYGDLNRPGQTNGSGSALANFEEIFLAEVDALFHKKNVIDRLQTKRSIEHGKSAVFDIYGGLPDASYFTPGNEVNTEAMNFAQRTINIDGLCLSSTMIYDLDEAMNHYDVRGPAVREIAYSLARKYHANAFATALNAARMVDADLSDNGFVPGMNTNGTVSGSGDFTATNDGALTGDVLVNACFAAAERFDELDVPEEERYFVVRPREYNKMASNGGSSVTFNVLDEAYGSRGSGISTGKIMEVAGIQIVKSNYLPNSNFGTGSGGSPASDGSGSQNAKSIDGSTIDIYGGNFSLTRGLFLQKRCMATVALMDIRSEMEYIIERQGYLMLAKYAVGHGILRPDCAIELTVGA